MSTQSVSEVIDQDRRQLLSNAAMGIAAAGAASIFPAFKSNAAPSAEVRPFRVHFPEEALVDLRRRVSATKWPSQEIVKDATQGVQLATMQKLARYWATDYDWRKIEAQIECLAAVRHRDRRSRHSFHSCALEAPERVADDRDAWMAGFDHRAAEDRRSADQPHSAWRQRTGRLPSGDPVAARLRVFGQADHDGLGSHPDRPRLGRADATPRIHADTWRKAAIGAMRSPSRWPCRRLRDWSASTPTCLRPYQPTSTSSPSPTPRRLLASPPTKSMHMTSSDYFYKTRPGLRPGDGGPAADPVRHRGLADRPCCMDARPRRAQLRTDRTGI